MRMAAIYARVSSEQQREENTIASQTASLIEFAQSPGGTAQSGIPTGIQQPLCSLRRFSPFHPPVLVAALVRQRHRPHGPQRLLRRNLQRRLLLDRIPHI